MNYHNGWKEGRIRDLVVSMDAGVSVNSNEESVRSEGKGILKTSCVTRGVFEPDENKCIVDNEVHRAKVNPKAGRIIMSRMNTPTLVGASAYVDKDYPDLFLPDRLWQLEPKKDTVDMKWLANVLASPYFRSRISSIATGTSDSMKNISQEDILSLRVNIPPLPEQRAIADLLSTWDTAIANTERLIAAKENEIAAFGQRLFNPRVAMRKIGWEVVKLKQILVEHGGLSTGKEEVYSVSVHKGLVNQVEHLGRSFSAANTDNYNIVHFGDIVYTKSPTGDFPLGVVKQSLVSDDVIVSPLYGVFSPQTWELGVVIDFYFESPINAMNYLRPIVYKGAKNTINVTNQTFLSGKLCLPLAKSEQKKIADFVMTARRDLDGHTKLCEAYKLQKQGLMQKLLTGKYRVERGQYE